MLRVTGYYEYEAVQGDTFDILALDMYNDEGLAHYIIKFNPDYADVIIFEGGEKLFLPVVENPNTAESMAPWVKTEETETIDTIEWNTIDTDTKTVAKDFIIDESYMLFDRLVE